jgi:hypothetical protein
MKCFVAANMFYFDMQLKSDLDCGSNKVKTHNDFMNYDLDPGPFTRSHSAKGGLEHLLCRSHSKNLLQAEARSKGN